MSLSSVEANKIVKSALGLLKIAVGHELSTSVLKILKQILKQNGIQIKPNNKKIKKGGSNSEESKALIKVAMALLKIAVGYELSITTLKEIEKLMKKNGYK